jgi:hypothetical protein
MVNQKLSNKDLEHKIYADYQQELRDVKNSDKPRPLHLYSKRVYRAYRNVWRLIDRRLLTPEEINIMCQLGIYKPSQTELGIRYSNISYDKRIQICKTRIHIN